MWFKKQTSAPIDTDPYLGPPQRAAARFEPVFDNTPAENSTSEKTRTPTTIDIDSAPLFLAQKPENTAPAAKPVQFQHKVANQSHNTPANIVAKKQTPAAHSGTNTPADIFTIPADVTIEGAVQTTKNITIAGTLKGDILQSTQVLVLPTGVVQGNITAQTIEIAGQVQGHVVASGTLTCRATAIVNGNITYGTLRVEEGAQLNGQLQFLEPKSQT